MSDTPQTVDTEKFHTNIFKALVVGIIGCVAVELIGIRVHLDLHFLDIFIALIVLGVVQHSAGEETLKIRLLSMGLMAVSLVVANLVLIVSLIHALRTIPGGDPNVTFRAGLPVVLQNLGIVHWVWVILSLAAAFDLLRGKKPEAPSKPPA